MGRPAEFLNVVITGLGRRMVADYDRELSASGTAVGSLNQSGGITAHTINITQPLSAMSPALRWLVQQRCYSAAPVRRAGKMQNRK